MKHNYKRRLGLIASYAPSLSNFRGDLIRELLDQGHDVWVFAPNMDDSIRSQMIEMGATPIEVPLKRTSFSPLSDLTFGLHLWRKIKLNQIDTVITYTIKPNIWGSFAAKAAGAGSFAMVTGLGFAFTEGKTATYTQRIAKFIAVTLFKASTYFNEAVIFQNPDDMHDFIGQGCLSDPDKAKIVNGSGVNMEHFRYKNLPPEPSFLMIARLLVNKGVREYGIACMALKKKYQHIQFKLAGDFDEGPDGIAASELEEWKANGIEYLGRLSDVREALGATSVYVLPSYREGTPRTVLEAMSIGRAVISTDVPGCRETVIHGETGFLVQAQNAEDLAQKMEILIKDDEARSKFSQNGYALALEKYDVKKVNTALLEIIFQNRSRP